MTWIFRMIFGNIINYIVLFALIGGGWLAWVTWDASNFTPEKVVSKFISLVNSPTDVLSGEDKNTIKAITDSNIISSIKYEGYIKLFREMNKKLL